jgi:uncharacterized protein
MKDQAIQSVAEVQHQAASLLLYQAVLLGEIGQAFLNVLQTLRYGDGGVSYLRVYGDWFISLATHRQSWQDYLLSQILLADNPFTQQAQQVTFDQISLALKTAARHDLQVLQRLYACSSKQISQWLQDIAALPMAPIFWEHDDSDLASTGLGDLHLLPIWSQLEAADDWGTMLEPLAAHYYQAGVGIFGQFRAFRWRAGELVGIVYPDPIRLQQLVGYESQRDALIKNTEALLAGYTALHVLLYGSRGSGKSSLVKSLLHQYGDRGLRLIEVSKSDLRDLVTITDNLRDLPQKFILFVDDLSFEEDEDAYKALKVLLEGNLTARPQNIVVYATSNRRHLIREFFGDRPRPSDTDEVHAWDTVQEKLSFSDRFGLTLTFEPANQNTYLAIVHHLTTQANLTIDPKELDYRALQWATRHNGRSGRTARQFVDFLQAEVEMGSTAKPG